MHDGGETLSIETLSSTAHQLSSNSVLESLLDPLRPDVFFEQFWDKRPLFVSGIAGRFDGVMTEALFVDLVGKAKLADRHLKYLNPSIGDRTDSLEYFIRKKIAWPQQIEGEQLASELRGGTLVFDSIQRTAPGAQQFCKAICTHFGCEATINAYLSAGENASAFGAHFDLQDVFVLQIEGEKRWQIWERERPVNPIVGFPGSKSLTPPALPADHTVLMTPGDLLYVPRGIWHWPVSQGEAPSLHLSLSLAMPKTTDIVLWLAQSLSEVPEFRKSLPFSRHQAASPIDDASLHAAFKFLAHAIAAPNAKDSAVAYMSFRAIRSMLTNK